MLGGRAPSRGGPPLWWPSSSKPTVLGALRRSGVLEREDGRQCPVDSGVSAAEDSSRGKYKSKPVPEFPGGSAG